MLSAFAPRTAIEQSMKGKVRKIGAKVYHTSPATIVGDVKVVAEAPKSVVKTVVREVKTANAFREDRKAQRKARKAEAKANRPEKAPRSRRLPKIHIVIEKPGIEVVEEQPKKAVAKKAPAKKATK